MAEQGTPITYRDAGVDISAGNALVERIAPAARATNRPGVLSALGGFGGLFDLSAAAFTDPVLVAATDGVGTKLRIAIDTGSLDGIGIDLVAMCVNDLICQGAEPLFFLDYFATGHLDVDQAAAVIEGIAAGCREAGAALLGGETAEMPGMYASGDFDLAGFAVGAAERGALLPVPCRPGDRLLGVASSGLHSNGFSLVRRVVERTGLGWADSPPFGDGTMAAALLVPTSIYVAAARAARTAGPVNAFAHITGGGLTENLPRVLAGQGARIDLSAWPLPPVFDWLARTATIELDEMLKTFNCGIGLVAVVPPEAVEPVTEALQSAGETVFPIGAVEAEPGVRYAGEFRAA